MVMAEGLEKEPKKMKAKLSKVFVKFLQEIETGARGPGGTGR